MGYQQSGIKLTLTIIIILGSLVAILVYYCAVFLFNGENETLRTLTNSRNFISSDQTPTQFLEDQLKRIPSLYHFSQKKHGWKPIRANQKGTIQLPALGWENSNEEELRQECQRLESSSLQTAPIRIHFHVTHHSSSSILFSEWKKQIQEHYDARYGEETIIRRQAFIDDKKMVFEELRYGKGGRPWSLSRVAYYLFCCLGLSACYSFFVGKKIRIEDPICMTLTKKIFMDPDAQLATFLTVEEEVSPRAPLQEEEEDKTNTIKGGGGGYVPSVPDLSEMREVTPSELGSLRPTQTVYELVVEEDAVEQPDGSLRWVPTGQSFRAKNGWQVIADYVKRRSEEPWRGAISTMMVDDENEESVGVEYECF